MYLRDLNARMTERVSVGSAGEQGDDPSGYPSISADGRFVAFDTLATNFTPGPGSLFAVYLRDRLTQTTELISVGPAGEHVGGHTIRRSRPTAASSPSRPPSLAAASGPASSSATGSPLTVTNASVPAPGGTDEYVITEHADISADGRFVAFESADDLVAAASKCCFHVFLRDMTAMTTTWIDTGNKRVKGESDRPAVSDDGRFVAFESLSRGGDKRRYEIFLRGPLG